MANASVNNMGLSALSSSIQKGLGKSAAGGVDDSFSQLFDQAKQDTKGPAEAASPVAHSRQQAQVPVRESRASNESAVPEARAQSGQTDADKVDDTQGVDDSQASSTQAQAEKTDTTTASAEKKTSEASAEEPDAEVSDDPSQMVAQPQATEVEKEVAQGEVAVVQEAISTETVETTEVAAETAQVDTAVETTTATMATTTAAVAATAAESSDAAKGAKGTAEPGPAVNASATAKSVHEIIAQQKQQAEQQAKQLAETWAAMSPEQQEEFKQTQEMTPQMEALLRNGVSRGNLEAMQRLFMNKGETVEATLDPSAAEQLQEISDVLNPEGDADLQSMTALQHANAEKMRAILELASQNMQEKRMTADAVLDQLSNQSGVLDSASKPSPLLAQGPVSSLGSILRPLGAPAPAAAPGQSVFLENRMTDPTWGNEFAKRISFMVRGQLQNAEIRLNPPELGQIAVRINMVQDHANISFSAQHTNVRDAIESALPRLRELLNEGGLQMGNVDVATHQQRQQHAGEGGGFGNQGGRDGRLSGAILPGGADEPMMAREQGYTRSTDRLVDYFA